jgi:hypothetical protein
MSTPATNSFPRAPLTHTDHALESSRDSGFDLSAAVGELVDNSFEAKATRVRIATQKDDAGSIVALGVADDGIGIPPEVLANVLSLGFSTRYGSRDGLGRFGMGLKLASLSHARRVEVYTRPVGQSRVFLCYLDLDQVCDHSQTDLFVQQVRSWPADFAPLMSDAHNHNPKPFDSGTLVVWRNIDRLQHSGRFGESVDERTQELTKFLARAYRRFIDKGLRIELDEREITLHDPLFILDNPRVTKKFGRSLPAEIVEQGCFKIDGHRVDWIVTLLAKELRHEQGAGGRAGKGREAFAELYIPDNEGKISVLRNGREIYYDLIPKLYPGGRDRIDRYIGTEISFPAALDEYFQVRNVKRGAEPVSKLREQIRKAIKKPIVQARRDIRAYWAEVESEQSAASGDQHLPAHEVVDSFEQTAPAGKANLDVTAEHVQQVLEELRHDMAASDPGVISSGQTDWIEESFEKRDLTIVDAQWAGKELLEIKHLSGKAIVKVNNRHPFIAEVVKPLRVMAKADPEDLDVSEVSSLLKTLKTALDLLFIAYAKAENMHNDPEDAYGTLRSHWGVFAHALVREGLKRAD